MEYQIQYCLPYGLFKKSIGEINRKDIKAFLREFAAKKALATVETAHSVIYGIFTEAIDDGLVASNPAAGLLKGILPPKNRRDFKDAGPFAIRERDRFLGHAQTVLPLSRVDDLKGDGVCGLAAG